MGTFAHPASLNTSADDSLSDAELAQAYLAGQDRAFTTIVQRYQPRLMHIARRYASNQDDALDIVQEAFLRASRGLQRFRWESSLSTWLHRLVMNCGYDFVHNRLRCEHTILDAENNLVLIERHLRYDPVKQCENQLTIGTALSALSPEQRDAIVQVDIFGHSVDSLAATCGVPAGTIKSRRARAKQQLRSLLREGVAV